MLKLCTFIYILAQINIESYKLIFGSFGKFNLFRVFILTLDEFVYELQKTIPGRTPDGCLSVQVTKAGKQWVQ